MCTRSARRVVPLAIVCAAAVGLVGCGVLEDTIEGITATGPATPAPPPDGAEDIIVTAEIESDASVSGELSITIDSPRNKQSLNETSVEIPFQHEFTVTTDVAFPLRGSRIEVDAGPGANWIECRILVDGDVVASHRSEGDAATAVCERKLQLGPS